MKTAAPKKSAAPVSKSEALAADLRTKVDAAHLAAVLLMAEEGRSATQRLRTAVGSLAYLRKLVA